MTNVHNLQPQVEPEADFEAFWALVPSERKRGKAMCRALFNQITRPGGRSTRTLMRDSGQYVELHLEASPREIIDGWRRYIVGQIDKNNGFRLRDGGKYTLLPATFLNRGEWMSFEDEV